MKESPRDRAHSNTQRKQGPRSDAAGPTTIQAQASGGGALDGVPMVPAPSLASAAHSAAHAIQMRAGGHDAVQQRATEVAFEAVLGGGGGRAVERTSSRRVQMKGGAANTAAVHTAAEHGTRGAGGALPHLERIQASFGAHDVSAVQAYVGGQAATANSAMGANAYASGNKVAFAEAPTLHTAAHEAAHVVQQRAGVSLAGGVGQVGDTYERNADAVADAVVGGRSAESMLGASPGAASVQRKADPHVQLLSEPVQMDARTDYSGQFPAALQQLNNMLVSSVGIAQRQKDATHAFVRGLTAEHEPDLGEQIIVGLLNLALGAALGKVGELVTAAGTRAAARLGTAAATRLEGAAGADMALEAGVNLESAVNLAVSNMVSAGTASVNSAVTSSLRISGSRMTWQEFEDAQLAAIDAIYLPAAAALNQSVSGRMATPNACWLMIDALFEAFRTQLNACYNAQFSKLTDVWFANQATTVGLGARPGVLQIELTTQYPDANSWTVRSANLVGTGAPDQTIRTNLGRRPLQEIGVPKVIRMNGSMGWGVMDCNWDIDVHGQQQASGASVSAGGGGGGGSLADSYMAGPQSVQSVNQRGPYGFAWLAAHHLHLHDLSNDDSRKSASNIHAGAAAAWNSIKGLLPGTIGNSNW